VTAFWEALAPPNRTPQKAIREAVVLFGISEISKEFISRDVADHWNVGAGGGLWIALNERAQIPRIPSSPRNCRKRVAIAAHHL
jgi:hypothetical protein